MSARAAAPADLPALASAERACFRQRPWAADALGVELARPGAVALVWANGGVLQGYALGWVVAEEAELARIAVVPEARRCGLGGALLADWLARAADAGAVTTFLDVRADNHPAVALYRAAGFAVVGRRPGYYADGMDALLMRRGQGES